MTGIVSGGAGIAGVIVGFCADRWLRSKGGERVIISDWKIQYRGRGEAGSPVDVPPSEAEFVQFFFTVDIFNTRDEPTGLRDVCVDFVSGGRTRHSVTPGDADSLKIEAMREDIADVKVVNLPPKFWKHLHLRRNVWGEDVKNVIAAEQVYLSVTDPVGKRHRYLISELPRHALTFTGR